MHPLSPSPTNLPAPYVRQESVYKNRMVIPPSKMEILITKWLFPPSKMEILMIYGYFSTPTIHIHIHPNTIGDQS